MAKQAQIGIGALALVAGAIVLWFTLRDENSTQPNPSAAASSPAPPTGDAVEHDDAMVATPTVTVSPLTMDLASGSALIREPDTSNTAYSNAMVDAQTLLNRFDDGRIVVRSRVVQIDPVYATLLVTDVRRGSDSLSETFDITLFPDTRCTLSYAESITTRPKYRAVETGRGGFDLEETAGEVVTLKSHCGSNTDTTSAQVRIDTAERSIFVELINDRAVQHLRALDTAGFMVAIEFDPKSFPSVEHRDVADPE